MKTQKQKTKIGKSRLQQLSILCDETEGTADEQIYIRLFDEEISNHLRETLNTK